SVYIFYIGLKFSSELTGIAENRIRVGITIKPKIMANFYCEYCGHKFITVVSLTNGFCHRHPDGRGKHKLYEGSEKSQYTCKHCGFQFRDLVSLTNGTCHRHPNGGGKGKHAPAL